MITLLFSNTKPFHEFEYTIMKLSHWYIVWLHFQYKYIVFGCALMDNPAQLNQSSNTSEYGDSKPYALYNSYKTYFVK